MCSFSSQLISLLFLTLPKGYFPQNTTFLRKTPVSNKLFPQNTTFLRKICYKLSSLNTCRKYNCLKHDLPINLVSDGIIQYVSFPQRTSVCIFPAKNKSASKQTPEKMISRANIVNQIPRANSGNQMPRANSVNQTPRANFISY